MTTTTGLPDEVLISVAQDFFASEWADAREEVGFSFAPGTEITEVCPGQDADQLRTLILPYVHMLEGAWGTDVATMFDIMEIPEDDWADALFLVFMGCRGHGIGLEDDYSENVEIAKSKLGRDIDPSPFYSEFTEFMDLAAEVVETDARNADQEPDPDALWQPGARVRVDARMPTGDRLKGSGTVVRGTADRQVIVTMTSDEPAEPWSYQGRMVGVDEDECEADTN